MIRLVIFFESFMLLIRRGWTECAHFICYFPDPGILVTSLTDHKDSVHGLSLHSQKPHLLSCSADSTVKLWDVTSKTPLLESYESDKGMF